MQLQEQMGRRPPRQERLLLQAGSAWQFWRLSWCPPGMPFESFGMVLGGVWDGCQPPTPQSSPSLCPMCLQVCLSPRESASVWGLLGPHCLQLLKCPCCKTSFTVPSCFFLRIPPLRRSCLFKGDLARWPNQAGMDDLGGRAPPGQPGK